MRFAWQGSDRQGKACGGEVEATGLVEAAHLVAADGVEVTSLAPVELPRAEPPLKDADAFVFFNRTLGELTRTGIPLSRAVAAVARDVERGPLRAGLEGVEKALREGRPLDEAMAGEPAFPPEYRMMVRAGIAAGNLPAVLSAVAAQASIVRGLRRAVVGALAYPIVALATGIGIASALAALILSVYRDMYVQFRWQVPAWLQATDFLLRSAIGPAAVLVVVVTTVVALWLWTTRTPGGERALWRAPLFGRIVRGMCEVRFLGALRILVGARAPLASAVPVAAAASGSLRWARAAASVDAALREGRPLGDALGALADLPVSIAGQLAQAERAGRLEDAVAWALERAREEAELGTGDILVIVEPLAIVTVGAVVGFLFVSLVAPYFIWLARMTG